MAKLALIPLVCLVGLAAGGCGATQYTMTKACADALERDGWVQLGHD